MAFGSGFEPGIDAIDVGEYTEYEGREGLKLLAEVKGRGRKRLSRDAGKPAEDIAAGVKCFPAGTYLIYYRTTFTTAPRAQALIFSTSSTDPAKGKAFKTAKKL